MDINCNENLLVVAPEQNKKIATKCSRRKFKQNNNKCVKLQFNYNGAAVDLTLNETQRHILLTLFKTLQSTV